jgi:hypothetical protein
VSSTSAAIAAASRFDPNIAPGYGRGSSKEILAKPSKGFRERL